MKIKLAVVGSGFGLYGLLPAFQQIETCSVVGISGRHTERLVAYCRHTAVPHYSQWREMLDHCRPDAIAVAVVPRFQCDIVKHALQYGISVFAEKPLCHDVAQARELLALAQAGRQAHMVDFLFPEIPAWRRAKELLKAESIGRVVQVTVNWSFLSHDLRYKIKSWKTDPSAGGGALAFYFSHAFFNLEFFLGKIQTLYCQLNHNPSSPGGGETVVNLLAGFQSGCTGSVTLNCAALNGTRHDWEFHGEQGTLTLENSGNNWGRGFELARYQNPGEKIVEPLPELKCDPALDERVGLVKSLGERFINWSGGGEAAQPDFAAGLRVQELIAAATKSFQLGTVIKV